MAEDTIVFALGFVIACTLSELLISYNSSAALFADVSLKKSEYLLSISVVELLVISAVSKRLTPALSSRLVAACRKDLKPRTREASG